MLPNAAQLLMTHPTAQRQAQETYLLSAYDTLACQAEASKPQNNSFTTLMPCYI